MRRPHPLGLLGSAAVSAVFTVLVAYGTLGVAWLLIGPALGAAAEIVVRHVWPDAGSEEFGAAPGPFAPQPSGARRRAGAS